MGEVLGRAVSGTEAVSREQWPERLKNGLDALNIRYAPAAPERLARYHRAVDRVESGHEPDGRYGF